jgi:hypothetical protein
MRIVKTQSFRWPVRHLLAADGGRAEVLSFEVTCKRLRTSEVKTLDEEIRRDKLEDSVVVSRVVTDWDLRDVDGAVVPWEQREQAFDEVPGLAGSIVRAFFASFDPKESEKN